MMAQTVMGPDCDDVVLEYGGLPHVLPLAVHLKFVWLDK